MIYSKQILATESQFLELLEQTKSLLLKRFDASKKVAPTEFENIVCDVMNTAAKGSIFDGTIELTGINDFPDIIIKRYFGVEVKMTISDKWVSMGNSILESTRIEDIEKIYIMFGKIGGKPDFMYRLYQDCLYDIGVTHSPRYKIDMRLKPGASIFDKMKLDYDSLRVDKNSIKKIKEYYKSQLKEGEELWWIDAETTDPEHSAPIIKSFNSSFSVEEKHKFRNESFVLFPEIFGKSQLKFERIAAYLMTNYNAVCGNIRDTFTAGGQKTIYIDNKQITLPHIVFHLWKNSQYIKEILDNMDEKKLLFYWRIDALDKDKYNTWLNLIDSQANKNLTEPLKLSTIFKNGLKNGSQGS